MNLINLHAFEYILRKYDEKCPIEAFTKCNEKIKQWYNVGEIDLDTVMGMASFNYSTFMYRSEKE